MDLTSEFSRDAAKLLVMREVREFSVVPLDSGLLEEEMIVGGGTGAGAEGGVRLLLLLRLRERPPPPPPTLSFRKLQNSIQFNAVASHNWMDVESFFLPITGIMFHDLSSTKSTTTTTKSIISS